VSATRRQLIRALALAGGASPWSISARPDAAQPRFAAVTPDTRLSFPRDHGAHPHFRIEWWYLTGWMETTLSDSRASVGLQITFFRVATGWQRDHTSRLAAQQLMFAHAAIAVPGRGRLIKAERAARMGLGMAQADEADTALRIGHWQLVRDSADRYRARISDAALSVSIDFQAQRPPLLQGAAGFSQKGPQPAQASFYYSRPWLAARGEIAWADPDRARLVSRPVQGHAWFDHEWSSELLDAQAQGWDWVGLHLADGSALTAFQVRSADGRALWQYARWVDAEQREIGATGDSGGVTFEPLRRWRSPRSGASWPVAQRLRIGGRVIELQPMFDDQELETRGSTGITYWEGAVTVTEAGRMIGRGYLELTGYAQAMRI
jgi:predicted secreted hydrolase